MAVGAASICDMRTPGGRPVDCPATLKASADGCSLKPDPDPRGVVGSNIGRATQNHRRFLTACWAVTAILVLLFIVPPLSAASLPEDPDIRELRNEANQLRREAASFREEATAKLAAADKLKKEAGELRAAATSLRGKGRGEDAAVYDRRAEANEDEAKKNVAQATHLNNRAAEFEQRAAARTAEADRWQQDRTVPTLIVIANAEKTIKRAKDELAALKERLRARFVGQPFMKRSLMSGYSLPESFTFTQAMLDERFKLAESELATRAKQLAGYRAAYAVKSADPATLAKAAYYDVYYGIVSFLNGTLSNVPVGLEAYVVPIYRQEKAFFDEYAATKKKLEASDTPYAIVKATLEALSARQNRDRKPTFEAAAQQFRADKNYAAFVRHEWMAEATRWHDLAIKLSQGVDVHRELAALFTDLIATYFMSKTSAPMSYGLFVGKNDFFFGTPYQECTWCKARPYPDIQISESSPQILYWDDVLNEKSPLQVTGRKDPGAAKTIRP
jgi:hypothetical protein